MGVTLRRIHPRVCSGSSGPGKKSNESFMVVFSVQSLTALALLSVSLSRLGARWLCPSQPWTSLCHQKFLEHERVPCPGTGAARVSGRSNGIQWLCFFLSDHILISVSRAVACSAASALSSLASQPSLLSLPLTKVPISSPSEPHKGSNFTPPQAPPVLREPHWAPNQHQHAGYLIYFFSYTSV